MPLNQEMSFSDTPTPLLYSTRHDRIRFNIITCVYVYNMCVCALACVQTYAYTFDSSYFTRTHNNKMHPGASENQV